MCGGAAVSREAPAHRSHNGKRIPRNIDEIDGREEFPCVAAFRADRRGRGGKEEVKEEGAVKVPGSIPREETAPSLCDLDRDVLQVPTDREKHELW